ncbi:hypothetical protein FACS1894180_6180 [Bacteroidia bacterium]|nr:hypothetical protein FACS1894180_6180 [Bacteroidia bacterium]
MKKNLIFSIVAFLLATAGAKAQDVYVAGGDYISGQHCHATVWKNGVQQNITDGSTFASANSVFVAGNDVYIAGYDDNRAALWKNGIAINLEHGNAVSEANSVFVAGNDVYVAGTDASSAVLWHNSVKLELPGVAQYGGQYVNLEAPSSANSVFVDGNDVYVAGIGRLRPVSPFNAPYYDVALAWKNGEVSFISSSMPSGPYEQANSIFVSDGDVYIAGVYQSYFRSKSVAKLWKNGVETVLTDSMHYASANSVFVDGNDVYAVGEIINTLYSSERAIMWKNQEVYMEISDARFYSVYVSNSDVYVTGRQNVNNAELSIVWKNGQPLYSLPINDGDFYSVFVVPSSSAIETVETDKLQIYVSENLLGFENLTGLTNVAIFDAMGRTVGARFIAPANNGAQTIDISHLPSGVYIVKAGGKTGKFIKK